MSVQCPFCGADMEYMTTSQVARLLDVAPKTVRKYVKQGRFPGTQKVAGLTSPMTYKIPVTAVLPLARRPGDEG